MRKSTESGASLVEYLMLMAFVAVIGIIGVRTVGPVAAGLFSVDQLVAGTTEQPAEVLGVTVERDDVTIATAAVLERPEPACRPAGGAPVRPVCPK